MSSIRSLKRSLKKRNVAIAEMVAKKRAERGYDHFANRRSTRPAPLTGPTTAQLVYPDESKPAMDHMMVIKESSKVKIVPPTEDLPKQEAFDKYPEGSQIKSW